MPNPTVPCQYRTGKTLSTGTYYALKEAIHIKTGKYYGCKIIRKKAMQGREHLVRNEIAVLKCVKSNNPNIVTFYDCFETLHSVYLCLDLYTGGTLFDRICNEGTYTESKAADLVRSILSAVKHIHDSGIEHRDLTPQTLHFRSPVEGAPIMITDFGLSRLTEEVREGPDDGRMEVYGVHRYMAPEIFLKPNHSKAVDIWGVGLVVFFMIAGYSPFDRDSVQLETDAIIAGEYKFAPADKWDGVSVNAREFINMCLAVNPDGRPTARDALAHTWLVPPTPRFIQVKSRTTSLLELRLPSFKRVFNPRRKWRIMVLTIKALNRMHTLAGHPVPSTQQEVVDFGGQDSSSIYSAYFVGGHVGLKKQEHDENSHDDESSSPEGDMADFPSPVSSLCTFDDKASWLTQNSMSTTATDDDVDADMFSTRNDPSRESLPLFPPSDSIHSESSGKEMTPEAGHFSSTASSVYSPGIKEATTAESTPPQSAADPPVSTFVIYTSNKLSPGNHPAINSEDVQILESRFEEGGLVVSTHRPTQAEAWVEDHYDDPLLESARAAGLCGPIAVMLSPEEPALAIFGSILDDTVLYIARTLADASQIAVMVRPVTDNPVSMFTGPNVKDEGLPGMPNHLVPGHGMSDDESDSEDEDDDEGEEDGDGVADEGEVQFVYSEGPALRLRGGKGDNSEEDEINVPWSSKAHKAVVWMNLWPDEKHEYSLSVRTKTTFKVQPERPKENSTETQPEVIGHVKLNVETRAKVLPDRSYTSLGFIAHRERSITDREFIDCGFNHPDQILKTIDLNSTQLTATANVGAMNLHPAGGLTGTYSNTRSKTTELADNKPTPRCAVFSDPGERWNRDGKSYISFDITTVPQKNPRNGIKHPLKTEFAMGINLSHEDAGPPQISFVTRNQVIMWIWDPTLKPKVRGLLVLMTTYIPNIRTRQELVVNEDLDVHFATEAAQNNTPAPPTTAKRAKAPESMAFSLSISPIQIAKSRKDALSELFTDVRRKFWGPKEPTLADLPLQEYISRGWDATNQTWRPAVWTSLDKDFRTTDLGAEAKRPVWKVGWNPREPEEEVDSEGSEDRKDEMEEDHDVFDGNPLGPDKGKGKQRDMGGPETPGAGPSMDIED